MKLAIRAVEIGAIRTDGGTQVREALDEAWIGELSGLYDDGHEIDPILLVLDRAGVHWVADGFHRLEAQRRLGHSTVKAEVRDGPAATLDMAKMLASAANKNGRPLQPGEKRRAILLARSTAEGRAMGVRELARHCGVTKSYVDRILEEKCPLGDTAVVEHQSAQARRHAELYARVDEALKTDPSKPSATIAEELTCDAGMVRRRRAALGIPIPSPVEQKQSPATKAVEALLRVDPSRKIADITRETGATSTTIAKARERLGLPPARRGGVSSSPSAPPRKGGDARDAAEVLQAHPAGHPPAAYASTAERDTAKIILDSLRTARGAFHGTSWALLLRQMDEIIDVRSTEG